VQAPTYTDAPSPPLDQDSATQDEAAGAVLHGAPEDMLEAPEYIRETAGGVGEDLLAAIPQFAKRHPGPTLLMAVAAGVLLGRTLSRR
jgi:hypothetical protein